MVEGRGGVKCVNTTFVLQKCVNAAFLSQTICKYALGSVAVIDRSGFFASLMPKCESQKDDILRGLPWVEQSTCPYNL